MFFQPTPPGGGENSSVSAGKIWRGKCCPLFSSARLLTASTRGPCGGENSKPTTSEGKIWIRIFPHLLRYNGHRRTEEHRKIQHTAQLTANDGACAFAAFLRTAGDTNVGQFITDDRRPAEENFHSTRKLPRGVKESAVPGGLAEKYNTTVL